jgi:integrase
VLAYIAERQRQGIVNKKGERVADVSNAEINRELQILKRAFSLAMEHGRIFNRPAIKLLQEAPARAGFLDRAQVDTICRHLSPAVAAVVRFAFITGWRLQSEVLPLQWHQVDLKAGIVRLEAGQTKNGEGREFRFTTELRELLEARDLEREALKTSGTIEPRVFVRMVAKGRRGPKSPKPITSIRKAWDRACRLAGCPGRIPHDLRRSAVRSFVRAGISQHVAMQLSGHLTASVFRRYNITSEADLQDAAARLDAHRDSSGTVTPSAPRAASVIERIS